MEGDAMNSDNLSENKTTKAEIVQTEFADIDRFHLTTGLFQIMGGKRKPDPVEINIDLSNGGKLRITAFWPLRPFDQKLLCAIVCKAAQSKKIISPDTTTELGIELRNKLELLEEAAKEKCLAYQTSARQLIEDMGLEWAGKKSIKQIEESLDRLFHTTFTLETYKNNKRIRYLFRLMSHVKLEDNKKDITMAFGLNIILAKALVEHGHYARINMEIMRSLEQAQQLLFVALCNAIDLGKKRSFTWDELREFIYGKKPENIIKNTYIKQISRTKALIFNLINSLHNWKIEEKSDLIWIKRPQ